MKRGADRQDLPNCPLICGNPGFRVANKLLSVKIGIIIWQKRRIAMEEVKAFLKSRTVCNLVIVLANIAVFFVLEIMGNTEDVLFMAEHGASYAPWIVEEKEYYRLFTCMFMHFGIEHLFNNMLVLTFLGDALEHAVGSVRYLIIYLGGGLLGNVLSCILEYRGGDWAVSAGPPAQCSRRWEPSSILRL